MENKQHHWRLSLYPHSCSILHFFQLFRWIWLLQCHFFFTPARKDSHSSLVLGLRHGFSRWSKRVTLELDWWLCYLLFWRFIRWFSNLGSHKQVFLVIHLLSQKKTGDMPVWSNHPVDNNSQVLAIFLRTWMVLVWISYRLFLRDDLIFFPWYHSRNLLSKSWVYPTSLT